MKQTMSKYDIADQLKADEYGGWSYQGALALAEWFEEFDADCGTETEFDRVAIRCDFSEYESLEEFASGYTFEPEGDDEEEKEDSIRDYIRDNGFLIEFDGGIIVSSF